MPGKKKSESPASPAKRVRKVKRVSHVPHNMPMNKVRSPKSPRDWHAWYRMREGKACPAGTHRAPVYDKIKSSKDFCVRNCKYWDPPKRQGKNGRCYNPHPVRKQGPRKQNAWMENLRMYRALNKDYTKGLTGKDKFDAMGDLTKDAGEIYRRILGKGATMKDFNAKFKELSAAMR